MSASIGRHIQATGSQSMLLPHCMRIIGLAVLGPLVAGCSPKPESTGKLPMESAEPAIVVVRETTTESAQAQIVASKDELFKRLSGRLMEVMSNQGPLAAIEVCQAEAAGIANAVGQELGVQIGRTGVRLRNPNNRAPEWATAKVQARLASPWFATLSDGRAVGLLPIKLQSQCLMCHGPSEGISPEVREQLKKHYPDDAAIGFREGELRGWFWVELSPSAEPQ